MNKTIAFSNREVPMTANAATPIRFRQVFGEDLLRIFQDAGDGIDGAKASEYAAKLAYIMRLQAGKKPDFKKASEESFYDFLEGFEPMDFIEYAEDIIGLYTAGSKTLEQAKKPPAPQSED